MQIKFVTGIDPEIIHPGMKLYDDEGGLIATIPKAQPIILTKALFDKLEPGATFRIVTTHLQNFHESFREYLKFICKKGGGNDWAIYCHRPDKSDLWIATHGDKVQGEESIRSICPCEDEVYDLYRH